MNRTWFWVFSLLVGLVLFFIFFAFYSCTSTVCFGVLEKPDYVNGQLVKHSFSSVDLYRDRNLDLEGNDVIVYLHIQKTGGATFGRHLVHNLDVDPPCSCVPGVKKCLCLTKNKRVWLVSRHSVGWICGLHADWTELTGCVDPWFKKVDDRGRKHRRYHYITMLRDPVKRFFSEWQHVSRGATWAGARLHCNGRSATLEEVPFCFSGEDWTGATFSEFVSCKSNLAFNRMTRMLSNLTKVNCYNRTGLDEDQVSKILVESAKENLLSFAFFGILEEQSKTQFLFEHTLGIKFINNLEQKEQTHVARLLMTQEMVDIAVRTNKQDIELYQFAKDLFNQRVADVEKRTGYTVQEYFDYYRDPQREEEQEEDGDVEDDSGMQHGQGEERRLSHYPGEAQPEAKRLSRQPKS
ncbi:heparan-sulfate 6-O-sulfotransferase 1 [Elysia marginata]|uniref:Heparan-sulfate 6-O-sulfotransferase n=1 Tax=Elysia marginata TaxID=1093978 RepID=A0AAV4HL00_9GAST|nr:heparan-sulfate 6-O-sulfotransferase 1 [Elysia marginata]